MVLVLVTVVHIPPKSSVGATVVVTETVEVVPSIGVIGLSTPRRGFRSLTVGSGSYPLYS